MQLKRTTLTLLGLVVALLLVAAPAMAASVTPVVVPGNPSCASLGYAYEFKIDNNPASGIYTQNGITFTVNNPGDNDGYLEGWSASIGGLPFGIDAVIMKGGDNANVYYYNPEESSDTNLTTPINPSNQKPYGTSHVSFCYDFEVIVEKTAETSYIRTYTWDITKDYDGEYEGLAGEDFGAHDYLVTVDQTVTDSDWTVSGTITVSNPAPMAATIQNVTDSVSGYGSVAVDCGVVFPYQLAAGAELECSYSSALPDATSRVNTATATTSGAVGSGSGSADVVFGEPTIVGEPTVNVTDEFDGGAAEELGSASSSSTFEYTRNFSCPSDASLYEDGVWEYVYNNTATITETGQSDDASVTVTCYLPSVEKTAQTSYTRTFTWTIDKSVAPDHHEGLAGDSFSSDYDVVVDQTMTESNFAVSGVITVHNPASFEITVDVADSLPGAVLSCNGSLTIPAGQSAICNYSAATEKVDGDNTATITWASGSASDTVGYVFGDPTTVVGYETINVTDTVEGALGSASADKTFPYTNDFVCPTDSTLYVEGKYSFEVPNTATITETGQYDDANVTVDCYLPSVEKTADATYKTDWSWTIEKSADQTAITITDGQPFTVNYTVTVNASSTDYDKLISGVITVTNPAPFAITVDVADSLPGAVLICNGQLTIPANSSAECEYSYNSPDLEPGTNVATITLANGFEREAEADYTFVQTEETDECASVTDDRYGVLDDEVCSPTGPVVFNYSETFEYECAETDMEYTIVNTATVDPNDVDEPSSDDWTVVITVPACQTGCTLTIGYWKTHSENGPAPYDDTWALLPNGASTPFYLSGQTWYQVFWTAPAGNAYYNLAHQYMGAYLNSLNGAAVPAEVQAAMTYAETLFAANTPTEIAALKGGARNAVIRNAGILAAYNEGTTGPGHCDEDSSSAR